MNEICRTCLSKGRRLKRVTSSHREMLRWMNIKMNIEANICWECEGHLHHLARFRVQAMKAQRTMNLSRGRVSMIPNMKSLSTLTERYIDIYDVTIDAETDTVTKHTNVERQITNLKEEPSTSTNFIIELKIEPESDDDCAENNESIDILSSEVIEATANGVDANDTDIKNVTQDNDQLDVDINTDVNVDESDVKSEIKSEMNDDEEWDELMVQPEVVLFDEEKNSQFTKDDFYSMTTMTLEELDAAREADRNGARYKFCPFKCETCILGYYHEDLLKKHMADRHSESATFVCSICSQHFFSEENLDGHYRSHFNGYSCRICGYNHHRYSMMDVHYIKVHKNAVKRCSPCSLYFPNYRMLKYHRETVHRALPTCAHCGKQYKTKAILKRHLIRHEATEFFECSKCHKSYRGREGLIDHMRKHEPKKKKPQPQPHCDDCNMTFKNTASYKNHMHFSLKHKGPEAMSPMPRKKSNLNNASTREARRKRMKRGQQLPEQNKSKQEMQLKESGLQKE